jgi:hypothetical protein
MGKTEISKNNIKESSYTDHTFYQSGYSTQEISSQLVFFNYLSNYLENSSTPKVLSEQDTIAAAAFKKITENKDFFGKLEAMVKKEYRSISYMGRQYKFKTMPDETIISDFLLEASRAFSCYYQAESKLVEANKQRLAGDSKHYKGQAQDKQDQGNNIIATLCNNYRVMPKRKQHNTQIHAEQLMEQIINPPKKDLINTQTTKTPINNPKDFLKAYLNIKNNNNNITIENIADELNKKYKITDTNLNTQKTTVIKKLNNIDDDNIKKYIEGELDVNVTIADIITALFEKIAGQATTTWRQKEEAKKALYAFNTKIQYD